MKKVSNTIRVARVSNADTPLHEYAVTSRSTRKPLRLLIVPGRDVTARIIPVAGSTPAQRRAAALATLAPQLAAPTEDCVVALAPTGDGLVLVCVAARSKVDAWMAQATGAGFTPDLILPDIALLPAPDEGRATILDSDDEVLIRTGRFACSAPRALARRLIEGLEPETAQPDTTLHTQIASRNLLELDGFQTQQAKHSTHRLPVRRLAGLAAAASLLLIAAPWATAIRADAAASALRKQSETAAATALPNARRIVDARAQLAAELGPWRQDSELFSLTVLAIDAVAATPGARLERLEVSADSGLSARLSVANPADMDALRPRLAAAGAVLQDSPAGASSDGGPAYSIVLRRQP